MCRGTAPAAVSMAKPARATAWLSQPERLIFESVFRLWWREHHHHSYTFTGDREGYE